MPAASDAVNTFPGTQVPHTRGTSSEPLSSARHRPEHPFYVATQGSTMNRHASPEKRQSAPRAGPGGRAHHGRHGIHDFLTAKRKAAERLGVPDASALPRNTEIEQALAEYQRLFDPGGHELTLSAQRRAALQAMHWLSQFEPRLVGPVLTGTATEHADIQLHVFADTPEYVALKLLDRGIAHEITERRVRLDAERTKAFPGCGSRSTTQIEPPCFRSTASARLRSVRWTGRPMPTRGDACRDSGSARRRSAAVARSRAARRRCRAGAGGRSSCAGRDHLLPVRHPAHGAGDGEHHREHVHGMLSAL